MSTSQQELDQLEKTFTQTLEKFYRKFYLTGLSTGGKAFVQVVYDTIVNSEAQDLPPSQIIALVKKKCQTLLNAQPIDENKINSKGDR